ncbi:hypothetical protein DFJ73DRAFT_806960 [Zopfochytrium polystomum]|nr:hypothetical protein DFJ73DRAFT_806960 [Zopfochytrium polystomum]
MSRWDDDYDVDDDAEEETVQGYPQPGFGQDRATPHLFTSQNASSFNGVGQGGGGESFTSMLEAASVGVAVPQSQLGFTPGSTTMTTPAAMQPAPLLVPVLATPGKSAVPVTTAANQGAGPITLQWGDAAIDRTDDDAKAAKRAATEKLVRKHFGEFFRTGRFSDLFIPKFYRAARPVKKLVRRGRARELGFKLSVNQSDLFAARSSKLGKEKSGVWGIYLPRRPLEEAEERTIFTKSNLPGSLRQVELDKWEDRILWDDDDEAAMQTTEDTNIKLIRNRALDSDDWVDAIVWDDDDPVVPPPFIVEDPTIVNDLNPVQEKTDVPIGLLPNNSDLDRFNLSNDHFYELSHKREHVRQAHSGAVLRHSLPAIMLMHPYYKTHMSIRELRSFHRPQIRFPLNQDIQFSRVKTTKKKKDKLLEQEDPLTAVLGLTLRDTSKFVLLEFSEEYPPILSNFGMGSLIQNYYRKAHDKDQPPSTNPDVGELSVLDKVDESPFFKYGDVDKGHMMQALTNNLFRAPLFKHDVEDGDFLLIRHTFQQKTRYYLREIPHLFVVGQTYPMIEVPRPQARKMTNILKLRLQALAYRMIRSNSNQRLWFPRLLKYFSGPPDAELKLKLRLREFAQYWKKGENTGWWKMKEGKSIPSEEEIQKIITPEIACGYETALAGEQRLRDIGYANMDFKDDNEDDETVTDIELQLAPWITTRNFIFATQGKGLVKLYGEGDPTGRGEGFSFIRQSMKEMFYREGEVPPERPDPTKPIRFSYAEQQVVYREEKSRIWNAQLRALSSSVPPDLTKEDEEKLEKQQHLEAMEESERKRGFGGSTDYATPSGAMSPPRIFDKRPDLEDDGMSAVESQTSNALGRKNKYLVINRLHRSPEGNYMWTPEVVSDPKVINAYLRQRKLIESQLTEAANEDEKKKQRRKKPDDQTGKGKDGTGSEKPGGTSAANRSRKKESKPASEAATPAAASPAYSHFGSEFTGPFGLQPPYASPLLASSSVMPFSVASSSGDVGGATSFAPLAGHGGVAQPARSDSLPSVGTSSSGIARPAIKLKLKPKPPPSADVSLSRRANPPADSPGMQQWMGPRSDGMAEDDEMNDIDIE